jgi:hypothetical protein
MANQYDFFNLMQSGGYNPLDGGITTDEMDAFKILGLINETNKNKQAIEKMNKPFGMIGDSVQPNKPIINLPPAQESTPQPNPQSELLKKQQRGNMLIALGDLLRGKDATAGFTQRQAGFDAQRERAERQAKQEEMLASMTPEQRKIYELYGPQAAFNYKYNKPERKIVEGGDGLLYYLDGSRVLPNVNIDKDKGDVFKQENDLRDEHQKLSGTFIDVRDAYGRILSNAEEQTAASDLSLIFNYMKMLDPGSVVREGEFANAQNSAGVPDRIRSRYNNVLNGERLAETTRQDFIQTAQSLYKTQALSQNNLDQNYIQLSEAYGLNPDKVVLDFGSPIAKKEFKYNLSVMSDDDLGKLDETQFTEEQIKEIDKEMDRRLK